MTNKQLADMLSEVERMLEATRRLIAENEKESPAPSPTPYQLISTFIDTYAIFGSLALVEGKPGYDKANAEFIVRACNSHEELWLIRCLALEYKLQTAKQWEILEQGTTDKDVLLLYAELTQNAQDALFKALSIKKVEGK